MRLSFDQEREHVERLLLAFARKQLQKSRDISIEIEGRSGEGDSQQNWKFDLIENEGPRAMRRGLVLRRIDERERSRGKSNTKSSAPVR